MNSSFEAEPSDYGVLHLLGRPKTPSITVWVPGMLSKVSSPSFDASRQIRHALPSMDRSNAYHVDPLPFSVPTSLESFQPYVSPRPRQAAFDGEASNEDLRTADEAAFLQLKEQGCAPLYTPTNREDVMDAPGPLREVAEYYRQSYNMPYLLRFQLHTWRIAANTAATAGGDVLAVDVVLDLLPGDASGLKALAAARLQGETKFSTAVGRWAHYIRRRLDDYHSTLSELRKTQNDFDEAWAELLDAHVLEPHECSQSQSLNLSRPNEFISARWEWRMQDAQHIIRMHGSTARDPGSASTAEPGKLAQMLLKRDQMFRQAKRTIERLTRRNLALSVFTRKTGQYLVNLCLLHRWTPFLDWAFAQLILGIERDGGWGEQATAPGEEELQKAMDRAKAWRRDCVLPISLSSLQVASVEDIASKKTTPTTESVQFAPFSRLPTEIRRCIWVEALPAHPTAHFFEIINTPPSIKWRSSWSYLSFRVAGTRSHDSGYLTVYKLLSTNRESRSVVRDYYAQKAVHRRGAHCRPLNPSSMFETFDWIPADDLVVLCFPPTLREKLPTKHAIDLSFGSGHPTRHVAILLSRACFHVWMQVTARFAYDTENSAGSRDIQHIINFIHRLRTPGKQKRFSPRAVLPDPAFAGPPQQPQQQQQQQHLSGGIGCIYTIIEGWKAIHGDEHRYSVLSSPPHDAFTSESRASPSTPAEWGGEEREEDNELYNHRRRAISRWRQAPVKWRFDEAINPGRWSRAETDPKFPFQEHTENEAVSVARERHVWWLGSGNSGLAIEEAFDLVERNLQLPRQYFSDSFDIADELHWPEYKGTKNLGWLMP